eukprot:COSAG01_NODE_29676_length_632_cov_1.082552_2_plen_79_part_00
MRGLGEASGRPASCSPARPFAFSDDVFCLRRVVRVHAGTTFMLTHWARDRVRGERLPIEQLVKYHHLRVIIIMIRTLD